MRREDAKRGCEEGMRRGDAKRDAGCEERMRDAKRGCGCAFVGLWVSGRERFLGGRAEVFTRRREDSQRKKRGTGNFDQSASARTDPISWRSSDKAEVPAPFLGAVTWGQVPGVLNPRPERFSLWISLEAHSKVAGPSTRPRLAQEDRHLEGGSLKGKPLSSPPHRFSAMLTPSPSAKMEGPSTRPRLAQDDRGEGRAAGSGRKWYHPISRDSASKKHRARCPARRAGRPPYPRKLPRRVHSEQRDYPISPDPSSQEHRARCPARRAGRPPYPRKLPRRAHAEKWDYPVSPDSASQEHRARCPARRARRPP